MYPMSLIKENQLWTKDTGTAGLSRGAADCTELSKASKKNPKLPQAEKVRLLY